MAAGTSFSSPSSKPSWNPDPERSNLDLFGRLREGLLPVRTGAVTFAAPVRVFQPLVGNEGHDVPLDEIGGMRHQSAARFVAAASGTSAIVVSQDGPISVIGRDGERVVQLKSAELLPG